MTLRLYRALILLATPLIALYFGHRRRIGKEDPMRFDERLGVASAERPEGMLVWFHGASVGEALAALPLIARILSSHAGLHVLMTTGTVTSARLMAERLPARARHQYVPIDRLGAVRRFLDHWRPDLALWMESEFWPNLIAESLARRLPMVLVNGRISDRSHGRWMLAPGLIRRLLGGFALCFAQSERDAGRLRDLGAHDVRAMGNLKTAAPPLPVDQSALDALRDAVAPRPLWLAASTHAGEEALAAASHRALAADHAGLLTVIAPRHPERGPAIAAELRALGLTVALRSGSEAVTATTDIYLADTLGELGLFYRLADIVFVGGSLVAHGGQNPLEPARLGCAIIHGPHMENFADFSAGLKVADGDGLTAAVGELLADAAVRGERIEAARALAGTGTAVLDDIEAALAPYLDGRAP